MHSNESGGADTLVRFEAVNKTYDGRNLVVQQLDLVIYDGEFLTLLGPSGSGKTTTLMMLAGFESPSGGEIYLAGRPLSRVPAFDRNIGMVFQNYALFPHMTVSQNIAFPLRVRKRSRAETDEAVARALDMVQLSGFSDRRPAQLSGGQQQRVAVARALVFQPRLVLMDEPLGALDKNLREQLQYELKSLHQRLGTTFVYVTHDQSEALTMSSRVAVFNDGMVQQLADPKALYERPANLFVARFVGENNEVAATVADSTDALTTIRTAAGQILRAAKVADLGAGDAVRASVRPEKIRLNVAAGRFPNTLDALVQSVIYLGDHVRVGLVSGCDLTLVAKAPTAEGARLSEGQTVTVGWPADDLNLFKC